MNALMAAFWAITVLAAIALTHHIHHDLKGGRRR